MALLAEMVDEGDSALAAFHVLRNCSNRSKYDLHLASCSAHYDPCILCHTFVAVNGDEIRAHYVKYTDRVVAVRVIPIFALLHPLVLAV